MSKKKTKKRTEFVPSAEVRDLIEHLRPQFGNMTHFRAGEAWGQLQPLYSRETKGGKTLDMIAALESEIKKLLYAKT